MQLLALTGQKVNILLLRRSSNFDAFFQNQCIFFSWVMSSERRASMKSDRGWHNHLKCSSMFPVLVNVTHIHKLSFIRSFIYSIQILNEKINIIILLSMCVVFRDSCKRQVQRACMNGHILRCVMSFVYVRQERLRCFFKANKWRQKKHRKSTSIFEKCRHTLTFHETNDTDD